MLKNKTMAVIAALTLSGCATIFSGSTQNIHVKVVDSSGTMLENTTCIATDGSGGSYSVIGNPGNVTVSKGHGALSIVCTKKNYTQLNTAVGDSFNGVALVNILFWPGFLVDAATGAYKKYPSHYVVTMQQK